MTTATSLTTGTRLSSCTDIGNFLEKPVTCVAKSSVDFKAAGLNEYDGLYAVVLDGVLSPAECQMLVRLAEESTVDDLADGKPVWERAMVNVGNGMEVMSEDTRKCGRIIMDNQQLVDRLWQRVQEHVPELQVLANSPDVTGEGPAKRRETWKLSRLNDRMRFLKYTAGEYFKPHQDGMYETPDKTERTYLTLHLYLNETTEEEPLRGGATTFHSIRDNSTKLDVQPKMGSVLIFQQRWLYHAGSEVERGTKLTMRTELMYEKTGDLAPPFVPRDLGTGPGNVSGVTSKRTKATWIKNKLGRR